MPEPETPKRDKPAEQLERENQRLRQENQRLKEENERLRKELEEALRAAKRQAAPHSRNNPKKQPRRPGRKSGTGYGTQYRRAVPKQVNAGIAASLPVTCPHCGGGVDHQRTEVQYQEEIMRRTIVRRFDVAIGECCECGRRLQGRHPLQTSDALGAAKVQLGPEALTLAALLNKQMGLSVGHTQQVLELGFGLKASRGGLSRALGRMARRAAPSYEELRAAVRQSLVVRMDETGWRVGGRLQWLHVAVGDQVTVYAILAGRGYVQSAWLVGEDYAGFLVHDGWAPYERFGGAFHQSCVAHLLRRCRDLVEMSSSRAAKFPRAVKGLLQSGLALRDRYGQGAVSQYGLRIGAGRLEAALDRLLANQYRSRGNQRLAKHLQRQRPWLLTFLHCPGLDATSNAAERALRRMVIARKVWGGNRSWKGAQTQQVLVSVLRTIRQQGKDPFPRMVDLLRSPAVQILDIVPEDNSS